ncbi:MULTISPECIES: hypothetical protein [unclassified Gilliamella]|jgi:hypothetical protein|uniref:hypothetical protein n=1 Tax=unclassified Gilliamella TaxID=2685620 RepID=UPI00080EDD0D|nr:hypothetical protein [Gilliamella apicola]OCG24194.1 hypothetical protein A9G46_08995 [Gilliamella apicola]OCG30595.1 hypothetical protein A9G45_02615 [Gilliamella apicola]OCG56839.1 hypothetical protein A9G30_02180 [Gilliamella apicola]OCG59009.1 hypothetical protein A9G40_08185 [Gilliamella apicola]
MAKSITEIQAKSDQKRGVKVKGFKLHVDDIALIEQASKNLDVSQAQLIVDAVKFYLDNKKPLN